MIVNIRDNQYRLTDTQVTDELMSIIGKISDITSMGSYANAIDNHLEEVLLSRIISTVFIKTHSHVFSKQPHITVWYEHRGIDKLFTIGVVNEGEREVYIHGIINK